MHRITIEGLGTELRVVRFHGWEAISEGFSFVVTTVAPSSEPVELGDLVGKRATLTLAVAATSAGAGDVRAVRGVVERAELGEEGKKLTAYRVTLAPTAHALRHRFDVRIFQELSVPDVVKKVLGEAGVAHQLKLSGSYEPREYCVQFRESDWDFVARLLEEEGIHTYFDHDGDDDVLVLADAKGAHAPIAGDAELVFRPPGGALVASEHVSAFRSAEERRTGKVTVRDYDFKKPSLVLESVASGELDGDLERYDSPGGHTTQPVGDHRARTGHERLETGRRVGHGSSACGRFIPGSTFTLAEHPTSALNREYLLTRVEHRGSDPHMEGAGGVPYENDFEVVAADVALRPARVTPKPVVHGIQTAIVVGPSGEEIHTDEHGRIKVQFHWDRLGKRDDKSSCWMRVAQAWAGPGYGAMFLPRVGHEVVVSFVDGDPDRPLVTGSVYHGANVPPYALPGNKTRSTVKTSSSPGGGGYNELRFEDKKGNEEVYLQAERDWNTLVKHDRAQKVGHDEVLDVGHDRTLTVGANETETIGEARAIEVGADHTEKIGANMTLSVGGNLGQTVGGTYDLTVSGASTTTVSGDESLTIEKARTLKIDKGFQEEVGGAKTVQVGDAFSLAVAKDSSIQVDGSATEEVKEKKTVTVGDTYTLTVGDGSVTVKKNGDIVIKGKAITIEGSGPIKVKGSKLEVESQGTVSLKASGAVKVQGGSVDVN
jgi:type VI secretion system secreted protein VgrG